MDISQRMALIKHGGVIVSWDFNEDKNGVLVVGRVLNGRREVLNAYQGEDAIKVRDILISNGGLNEEKT